MLKYFQFFVVILTFHELSAGNGLDALINDVFVVKPKGRIDTNKSCECVLYYLVRIVLISSVKDVINLII